LILEGEEANNVQDKLFMLAQQEQEPLHASDMAENPELLRNGLYGSRQL
jgi:hypothetical protein